MFDVDRQSGSTRIKQVIESSKDATGRGWHVTVSNPCFELWLLLHVTDDLTGVTDRGSSVEDVLRSLLGGYDKRRVPGDCLNTEALSRAIARARLRDADPENPVPKLPGTRVYRLLESILRTHVPR